MSSRTLLVTLCIVVLAVFAGCSTAVDVDSDGISRTTEKQYGLDDFSTDSDSDSLDDEREFGTRSLDASKADTDGDGLNDSQELKFGSHPSKQDTDSDGLEDRDERGFGTKPTWEDTDGDGLSDGAEVDRSISPTNPDTDGDGLSDEREARSGTTEPDLADTDGDGLDDGREHRIGTAPHKRDTDGDGLNDGAEERLNLDPLERDTEGDGLSDGTEIQIRTDPLDADTDGDERPDEMEYRTSALDPTTQDVRVEQSPDAGWESRDVRRKALKSIEFLSELPRNRTKRNQTVTTAATTICDGHDKVVPEKLTNTTQVGQVAYRNTYRVEHAAATLQNFGASVDTATINRRMRMAREYGTMASKYAPVFGSYQRLHDASCAVKRGIPGAKEDFYIASSEFAADLALAQQGVVYKASFKTTGMAAQTLGMNRLARVCGYKCVGLVQSELHWLVRGTYSGALDTVSREAIDGNLTVGEWNDSVRREVGRYLGNRTGTKLVGRELVPEDKVVDCVGKNLDIGDLWKHRNALSKNALDALRSILTEERLPEDGDLAFLRRIEVVDRCLSG